MFNGSFIRVEAGRRRMRSWLLCGHPLYSDMKVTFDNSTPLEIHDLTVAYQRKPVLWGIDLEVPRGKLVGIVGPNGAGKSTLIKAALGLVPGSSGWVKVFGQPAKKKLKAVGYVQQRESVDWGFPGTRSEWVRACRVVS